MIRHGARRSRRARQPPASEAAALRSAPFDLGGYRVKFAPGSSEGSSYVEISVVGAGGRILN